MRVKTWKVRIYISCGQQKLVKESYIRNNKTMPLVEMREALLLIVTLVK